jgi:hypothetical protein
MNQKKQAAFKISMMKASIESTGVTALASTLVVDLVINENEVTLGGQLFSPSITKQPASCLAMQVFDDESSIEVKVISKIVKNGEYYDVVIAPIEDTMSNVIITVL